MEQYLDLTIIFIEKVGNSKISSKINLDLHRLRLRTENLLQYTY